MTCSHVNYQPEENQILSGGRLESRVSEYPHNFSHKMSDKKKLITPRDQTKWQKKKTPNDQNLREKKKNNRSLPWDLNIRITMVFEPILINMFKI